MSDFPSYDQITLNTQDYNVDFQFEFPTSTDASSNDGFLPTDTLLTAVSATAFNEAGEVESDLIVGTPAVLNNVVTVNLKHPGDEGRYSIRFMLYEGLVIYEANFLSIFCF